MVDTSYCEIITLLTTIDSKIDKLSLELEEIKQLVNDDLKNQCEKMGEHIDFIEDVYDNVKHPLTFICNKIKSISGSNNNNVCLPSSNKNNAQ